MRVQIVDVRRSTPSPRISRGLGACPQSPHCRERRVRLASPRGAAKTPSRRSIRLIRSANRAAVSIYAMDPRALDDVPPAAARRRTRRGGPGRAGEDRPAGCSSTLATDTDGAAIVTAGATFLRSWPRLTADLPGHYVLTLRGAGRRRNFHPVDGARAAARAGGCDAPWLLGDVSRRRAARAACSRRGTGRRGRRPSRHGAPAR